MRNTVFCMFFLYFVIELWDKMQLQRMKNAAPEPRRPPKDYMAELERNAAEEGTSIIFHKLQINFA